MQLPPGLADLVVRRPLSERVGALRWTFARLFKDSPTTISRAPGRVNLIGEHTDYNEGFVLPAAIDRDVLVAARPRADGEVVAYAADFDRCSRFSLKSIDRDAAEPWSNYVRGVASNLIGERLPLLGADLAIASDLPMGAGLSSSAALELAVAQALLAVARLKIDANILPSICRRAEREFVGVQCGIMDQYVSLHGCRGKALLLDCRDLTHRYVPVPKGTRVVVTDSLLRRQLADTGYNDRQRECNESVRLLKRRWPGVGSLRDVTMAMLGEAIDILPPPLEARCRHVVRENARVQQAAAALDAGDLPTFCHLMDDSHESLRRDFAVSLPELDLLVQLARQAGALGARLTGAGFGGCIVGLLPGGDVTRYARSLAKEYQALTGRRAASYICTPADGAGLVT